MGIYPAQVKEKKYFVNIKIYWDINSYYIQENLTFKY